MVVVCCKRLPREETSRDYDEFLVEFPNTANVGAATDTVTQILNARVRLTWMAAAAKELAKEVPDENQRHVLTGPGDEAQRYLAIERATVDKRTCRMEDISELFNTLKGAVMILFPQHCSGTDALRRLATILEDDKSGEKERGMAHRILSILDDNATTEDMVAAPAVMWWSGKPMQRDADFVKFIGKNEKTKIVVKLTREGAGAPPRESGLDGKTQQAMMSYWFKKQEEAKKLVEDEDISYGNSRWADPQGLKSELTGTNQIKYKPV